MNRTNPKKILKESIRQIVKEELELRKVIEESERYDIVSHVLLNELQGYAGGESGEGDITGGAKLSSLFTGFGDITKALKGGALKILQKGSTLFKTVLGTIASTLIPTVDASFDKIFAKDRAAIKQIEGKYGTVYDRVSQSLGSDAKVMAFFLSPGAYLTAAAAKKAPQTVSELYGGLKDVLGIKTETKSYWMQKGYLLYEAEVDVEKLASDVEKYRDAIVSKLKPITTALIDNLDSSVEDIVKQAESLMKGDLGDLRQKLEDPKIKEKLKAEIEKEADAKKLSDADKAEALKVLDNIPKLAWPSLQGPALNMIMTKIGSLKKIDTKDSPEAKTKIDGLIQKLQQLHSKVKSSQGPA